MAQVSGQASSSCGELSRAALRQRSLAAVAVTAVSSINVQWTLWGVLSPHLPQHYQREGRGPGYPHRRWQRQPASAVLLKWPAIMLWDVPLFVVHCSKGRATWALVTECVLLIRGARPSNENCLHPSSGLLSP